MEELAEAVAAVADGEVVVYPTETVYGLGADARSPAAIERVFALKGRERDNPLSVAVPDIAAIERVADPTPTTRQFMDAFLPGPVTVVCPRRETVPPELTGGRDRVGVRVPAHDLARELLERTPPLTATSANPSGGQSVQDPSELDPSIRDGVAVVLDGGRTDGTPSTVVDVDRGTIHRRGAFADAIAAWLDAHAGQSPPSP